MSILQQRLAEIQERSQRRAENDSQLCVLQAKLRPVLTDAYGETQAAYDLYRQYHTYFQNNPQLSMLDMCREILECPWNHSPVVVTWAENSLTLYPGDGLNLDVDGEIIGAVVISIDGDTIYLWWADTQVITSVQYRDAQHFLTDIFRG